MAVSSPPFSSSSLSSDSEIYNVSSPESPSDARPKPRGTRCRSPGKQRRNASEKEKLRMRDLTKALHTLRTFLPPFVAPAGQTLTKIETLRLAIRYISYLSSQLDLQMSYSQNPELRTQRGSTSHSEPNVQTEHFHFQPNVWTERVTPYTPHGDGVCAHATLQSGSGFIPVEIGRRGGIKEEIPDGDELACFDSLTNPRTSRSHQGSIEDEQRERAAHSYWI